MVARCTARSTSLAWSWSCAVEITWRSPPGRFATARFTGGFAGPPVFRAASRHVRHLHAANLAVSTGDEDENAINVKLANTNLFFLNKEKSKIFTLDGGLTHNSAVGKNFIFDRIDLGAGYLTKSYWDSMFNSKLTYFLLNYSANASARLDNSYSLSAGFSKKLNEALTSGLNATYNINSSNLDAYTYKKYTILFTLSYSKGF